MTAGKDRHLSQTRFELVALMGAECQETRTGKQSLRLAGADPKESGGLAESRSPRAQLHGGVISWHRDSGDAPTAKAKNLRLICLHNLLIMG